MSGQVPGIKKCQGDTPEPQGPPPSGRTAWERDADACHGQAPSMGTCAPRAHGEHLRAPGRTLGLPRAGGGGGGGQAPALPQTQNAEGPPQAKALVGAEETRQAPRGHQDPGPLSPSCQPGHSVTRGETRDRLSGAVMLGPAPASPGHRAGWPSPQTRLVVSTPLHHLPPPLFKLGRRTS